MDSQTASETHSYVDLMLEHMPVGVALFDAENLRLLAANALYHTFLNMYLDPRWRDGRAIGCPITDWLPKEEPIDAFPILRTVAETGIPYRTGEYAFHIPQHGLTYWNWTVDPVRDHNGQISQLLLTASDVTTQVLARQQAEQAQTSLSQMNQRVEAERKRLEVIEIVARSVRESLDIVSISRVATEAICTHFNAKGVYVHTAAPAQKTLHMLYIPSAPGIEQAWKFIQHVPYESSFLIAQVHGEHNPLTIADLQTAFASPPIANTHPMADYTLSSDVHGYICVPLWFKDRFEGTLTALFDHVIDADGPEVQVLVGCGTHIAAALAHARLHTTLENERARLRTALDQLPEGILLVEAADGIITYANAAAADILGVPFSSLIGMSLKQHLRTDSVANPHNQAILSWNFAVINALWGKTLNSQEIRVTRPDGSKVVILSSTESIRTDNGLITGAVIVFQDINVRKSLEQQKNEFISIASHELRTPITSIQGFAEILQMIASQGQSLDSPYSLRALSGIVEQSEHLTGLIEEMLDISRIEHLQLLLDLAPHDLLHILTHTIESQAITSKQHKLRLVLAELQPTDVLMGWFDKNRFEQVLSNLISNAIKYSPAGSEIEIGLRPIADTSGTPHEALLWVRDQGVGIPPTELPHIFECFHRAGNFDRSISGLGIGLYLTKELVTRHGGRIWVESTEGNGSTFYVTLPLDKRAIMSIP